MEALYCGVPVITTNIPPHREFYNGYADFYKVGDIDELGKLILDRLQEGMDTIDRDRARNYVLYNFSVKKMADRFEYFIGELKNET